MILVKTAVMMVNKICTIKTYTLNLVDWIGKANPGRTSHHTFCDWLNFGHQHMK